MNIHSMGEEFQANPLDGGRMFMENHSMGDYSEHRFDYREHRFDYRGTTRECFQETHSMGEVFHENPLDGGRIPMGIHSTGEEFS
jgi:hypothetical protein